MRIWTRVIIYVHDLWQMVWVLLMELVLRFMVMCRLRVTRAFVVRILPLSLTIKLKL